MEATTAPELGDPSLDDLSATDLVGAARDRAAAARRVEADIATIAYQWAVAHPVESSDAHDAAAFHHGLGSEPISGDGTPGVQAFCVAERGAPLP